MKLYMESTLIAPEKTAAEITAALVKAGARSIHTEYANGKPTGLSFSLDVDGKPLSFSLPVRVDPIFAILTKRRTPRGWLTEKQKTAKRIQAERVAWRQLLRWIQAQLAFIETGMVRPHEVFFPYLLHPGTRQTVFEYFDGEGMKRLAAGSS